VEKEETKTLVIHVILPEDFDEKILVVEFNGYIEYKYPHLRLIDKYFVKDKN
jgi:hypothetical protein